MLLSITGACDPDIAKHGTTIHEHARLRVIDGFNGAAVNELKLTTAIYLSAINICHMSVMGLFYTLKCAT